MGQRYLRSWDALGKLLEEGKSWSGRERNVCYLNTGQGEFSQVSALAGFDHASDGRGQALTDWDGDGDLDVWQTNRSAPRVRFLQNQLGGEEANYLRLYLVGQTCNSDAIGARVVVKLSNGKQLLRTLRAGEGYLGQSSKVLHFGLPKETAIESVAVHWPGDAVETLAPLVPGKAYTVTQGQGAVLRENPSLAMVPTPGPEPEVASPNLRLVPHGKLPLPTLPYHLQGEVQDLAAATEPTLALLWAPWCQACLSEIQALRSEADRFEKQGLRVLLINVEASPANSEVAPGFVQAQASPAFLEAYDVLQRALPGRERPAVLPSSFLISDDGELLVHYRGRVSPETILADLTLTEATADAFRDRAVPFPGTWLQRGPSVDLLGIPNSLLALRQTEAAFTYLEKHVSTQEESSFLSKPLLSEIYTTIGSQFLTAEDTSKAKLAWIRALQQEPRHLLARERLAQLYEKLSEPGPAIEQCRQILKLDPNHLAVANSLAWLLASASDPVLRQPAEAERLARKVCRAVGDARAEPLDTLAAAQAAGGRFPEAIATAERGLKIALESGQAGVAKALQERLALYKSGRAYVQPLP